MTDLLGRSALITGGGRGVGAAVARALAREGAAVMVAARSGDEVARVARDLAQDGAWAWSAAVDVADPSSVERLVEAARVAMGRVDILVNGAGVASAASLEKTTIEEWDRLMAVNARGAFLCLRAVLPGMVERGWGRVVNIASVAGLRGDRYIAAYAASKHALIGLTQSAAAEVASAGVTVNAVCPGYLDTAMTHASIARIVQKTGRTEAEALDAILATNPQRRLIPVDEVAAAVRFLCGDAARSITGEALIIDGGELRR